MIKTTIVGSGGEEIAAVNKEGTLNVVVHPHPPLTETVIGIPTVENFVDAAGSADMQVVGTAAVPIEFCIQARRDYDVFVKTVMITIADAGASLNEFGSIGELTNGVDFYWFSQDLGEFVIKNDMTTNWDFIKLSRGNPSFGTGSSSFRANNVSNNSEGFLPVIDFNILFGQPFGIRLRKGTLDKLVFQVRDDTTGVDEFTAEASITLY